MKLSIVIPCYNEAGSVPALMESLFDVLSEVDLEAELICVDDASTDQTHALLMEERAARGGIKIIRLARNFGKEAALVAGLDHAEGDLVLFMDGDLQHPPNVIPALIEALEGGVDVAYGVRDSRKTDGVLRSGLSRMFYRLFAAFSRVDIPANAGDFRVMTKRVADALRGLPERRRFMKGLYAWVGFKQVPVLYTVEPRFAGTSSWSLGKLFGYGVSGIVSFSNIPLRIMSVSGFLIAALSALYAVYIFIETIIAGRETPGFATLATALFFLSGVQLLCIGIVGEYIGRIFDETKGRPSYIIESIDD